MNAGEKKKTIILMRVELKQDARFESNCVATRKKNSSIDYVCVFVCFFLYHLQRKRCVWRRRKKNYSNMLISTNVQCDSWKKKKYDPTEWTELYLYAYSVLLKNDTRMYWKWNNNNNKNSIAIHYYHCYCYIFFNFTDISFSRLLARLLIVNDFYQLFSSPAHTQHTQTLF